MNNDFGPSVVQTLSSHFSEADKRNAEVEKLRVGIIDATNAKGAARVRIHELETALNRMICAHENLSSNTEGQYPPLDSGCIECTVGCVPDRYNTGLCAYHNAKKLLGQL